MATTDPLCLLSTLASHVQALALPSDKLTADDVVVLAREFKLTDAESNFIAEQLLPPVNQLLLPHPIETEPSQKALSVVKTLNGAAQRLDRVTSFGKLVLLFKANNFQECFPDLSTLRQETEKKILAQVAEESCDIIVNDCNALLNRPLMDVDSDLRCMQFAVGAEGYLCGDADHHINAINLFHFKSTGGRCLGRLGHADGRSVMAVFDNCIREQVNSRLTKSRADFPKLWATTDTGAHLQAKAIQFVKVHEVAHTIEAYRDNIPLVAPIVLRSMQADERLQKKWKQLADFHSLLRELSADYAAISWVKEQPVGDQIGYLQAYSLLPPTALVDIKSPESQLGAIAMRGFRQSCAGSHFDQARFYADYDTLFAFISSHRRKWISQLDQYIQPHIPNKAWTQASTHIQRERLVQQAIRVYFKNHTSDDPLATFLKSQQVVFENGFGKWYRK